MVKDCEKLKKKKVKNLCQQGKSTQKKTYPECGTCYPNSFLVDPSKYSNLHSLSKMWQKIPKNSEKRKRFGIFVIFGVNLRFFFNWKTAIISSEKPTGQRTSAMLSILNIIIHEVYRKFDKNCLKTLKIGKFLVFTIFGFFLSKKTALISS